MNGRVGFGSIENANVSIYDYDDLTTPIGTTTSSTGASVGAIGNFSIPVPLVLSSDVFLVVVTGGSARDVDENGVLDGAPTVNGGVVHAVVRGAELRAGLLIRVSTVSECVYQRTRFLFAGHYP